MDVSGVSQGTVINSGGSTYVADKLTMNLLGVNLTQRQLLTGIAGLLLGYVMSK